MRFNNRWCVGSRHIIGMSEANRGAAAIECEWRARDYGIEVNDLNCRPCQNVNGPRGPMRMMRGEGRVKRNRFGFRKMGVDNSLHAVGSAVYVK